MDCSSDDGLLLSSTPGTVPGVAEGALDAHAAFGEPPSLSPQHRRMTSVDIDQPPGAPRKPKRQRVLPPPGATGKNSARRLALGDSAAAAAGPVAAAETHAQVSVGTLIPPPCLSAL